MNERIRELAAKTGIYGAVDINGNYDNEAEVKKFAELIVRECIKAVDNVGGYNEEFHMNAIKEHFGVEE